MSNKYNNVLYIGVTNDLVRRIAEHKAKINKGFTYKYNVDKLVYFEKFALLTDAIAREKQLKNWKHEWKDALINKENPEWNDLANSIGVDEEYVKAIKEQYVNKKEIINRGLRVKPAMTKCPLRAVNLNTIHTGLFAQFDGKVKSNKNCTFANLNK
jgi:putative endonuclease